METLGTIAAKFENAMRAGNGFTARCPAHDDRQNSLTIGSGDDGRILLHCFAGCETKDILAAKNLSFRDIAPSSNGKGQAKSNGKGRIVAAYDYRDSANELLYQAVRKEPKAFLQRRPNGNGGWTWNMKGVERVLYRLPELRAADPKNVVFIVEGEKDVDRLRGQGLVACCNIGGAGKWLKKYNDELKGRHVAIIPDNDEPGRQHAEKVAAGLHGKAANVKIVALPGLPDKGDVSDWLDAGRTAAQLNELVRAAAEFEASESELDSNNESQTVKPLTDLGNAERFVDQHGRDVRYRHPWKKWLEWDGQRWKPDATEEVIRKAKQTVRGMLREAADADDRDRRKQTARWALASEKADRIMAMVKLAKSESGIPITPADLDRNPFLLNVQNGTIDLKTGKLRQPNRTDHLTALAPVEDPAEPGVDCPRWQQFLDRIFDGNLALIEFIQRLLGYSLIGKVYEHVLPIFYGRGHNGKTVLIETILNVLGPDYAMKAPHNMLMARRNDSHPTEVADLFGKRFVAAVESDQGRRIAESLVKELTGGDRIRARRMREDFWEFAPSHLAVLVTNHKPDVKGDDNGIWRRLRLVPFNVTIPPAEQDPRLTEKLLAEGGAILRWLVAGCIKWQRDGLQEPPEVTAATSGYRGEQDVLTLFFDEACILAPDCQVRASALHKAYTSWCNITGESAMSQRKFGVTMTERGFERKTNNGTWYLAIGLRDDDTEATEG